MDYSKAPFEIKCINTIFLFLVMRLTQEELKPVKPSLYSISDYNLGRDIILTPSKDLPKRFGYISDINLIELCLMDRLVVLLFQ